MSIFLTRPVINIEEERNAKADILERFLKMQNF